MIRAIKAVVNANGAATAAAEISRAAVDRGGIPSPTAPSTIPNHPNRPPFLLQGAVYDG